MITLKPKVYLIRQRGTQFVKIGYTNNVRVRVMVLSTGSAQILDLLGVLPCQSREMAMTIEQALHDKYQARRVGGEWFDLPEDTLKDLAWWLEFCGRFAGPPPPLKIIVDRWNLSAEERERRAASLAIWGVETDQEIDLLINGPTSQEVSP